MNAPGPCTAETGHLPGSDHRWQECPTYHEAEAVPCRMCLGRGKAQRRNGGPPVPCPACSATGRVPADSPHALQPTDPPARG